MSLHLACILLGNRHAVAYGCRDVTIILRHAKSKKSQRINTFHNEREKVFEPLFVLESTWKEKNQITKF